MRNMKLSNEVHNSIAEDLWDERLDSARFMRLREVSLNFKRINRARLTYSAVLNNSG